MSASLPDQAAAYAAGAIVPVPAVAGHKRAQDAREIARQATELAAKRRAEGADRAQGKQKESNQEQDRIDEEADALLEADMDDTPIELGRQEERRAQQAPGKHGWLTVSIPEAERTPELKITRQQVKDALYMMLMELSDESRDGGAVEGVPEKPTGKDETKPKGPWFYEFESKEVVRAIVAEWGPMLVVEDEEGREVGCAITVCKDTSNREADSLASAAGFWGEVFIGKERAVKDENDARRVISEQLNVLVGKCKYSGAHRDSPAAKTKVSFSAELIPGQSPMSIKFPAVLKGKGAQGEIKNMTYRLEKGFFPTLCVRCHQKLKPDSECVVCERDREQKAYAKKMREAAMAAQRAKKAKAPTDPGKAKAQEEHQLRSQRERKRVAALCRAQNKCPFFQAGRCGYPIEGEGCRFGKHEKIEGAAGPA